MLNRYPPEVIVPALTYDNREVKRYAAMMLGIRQDDQLVPFLADLLQSGSVPARRAAAFALGTPSQTLPDAGPGGAVNIHHRPVGRGELDGFPWGRGRRGAGQFRPGAWAPWAVSPTGRRGIGMNPCLTCCAPTPWRCP